MRRLVLLLTTLACLAVPSALAKGSFPETIALPNGFQPEGIASARATRSTSARFPPAPSTRATSAPGRARPRQGRERSRRHGAEVDRGRLWVSGASTGKAFVYDARTGALVSESSSRPAATRRSSTTSSSRSGPRSSPIRPARALQGLAAARRRPAGVPTLTLAGDYQHVAGFNLNGIDATAERQDAARRPERHRQALHASTRRPASTRSSTSAARRSRTATASCSAAGRSTSCRTS